MLAPHFDIPFRLNGGPGTLVGTVYKSSAAVVEQDTFEDISNCVEVIVRTPIGFREDNLEFGFPHFALLPQPLLSNVYSDLIMQQEPRAEIAMAEKRNEFDTYVDRILVEVSNPPERPEGVVIYGLHQGSA